MVGAGFKSSFRCKKNPEWEDKHLLNFGAKTKPHWRETRPWLVHNEIIFPMSKMLHWKRNIRLTLAPNTIVYNLPFLILPMWNSRSGTSSSFFPHFFIFFLHFFSFNFFFFNFSYIFLMPKVGGAVYTWVRLIHRYLRYIYTCTHIVLNIFDVYIFWKTLNRLINWSVNFAALGETFGKFVVWL